MGLSNNDASIKNGYSVITKEVIHQGPVKLRIDSFTFNGKIFRKEVVEHNPSVGIIPALNENEIILIRQFRHAVGKILVEIPAGKIESDEMPMEAAKRELAEETGFRGVLSPITNWFLAPSYDTEQMHFFVAKNLEKIDTPNKMDEDERIETMVVSLQKAVDFCYDGTIIDCKTISAILLYYVTTNNKKQNI